MQETYIDKAVKLVEKYSGLKSKQTLRYYALLALVKGENVTLSDVHDGWSMSMNFKENNPPYCYGHEHKSIVPFDQLSEETQARDLKYMYAIRDAAKELNSEGNPKRYCRGSLTAGYIGSWYISNDTIHANIQTLDEGQENLGHIFCTNVIDTLKERLALSEGSVTSHGTVSYNQRTMCYIITIVRVVSTSDDTEIELFRQLVDRFNLNGCQYDVEISVSDE